MSPSVRNIVILGGSYAGVSIAHYTLKHTVPLLNRKDGEYTYRVVLVSPQKSAFCRQACPRALLADSYFNQAKLFRDIQTQLAQYSASSWTFVNGAATAWDYSRRVVTVGEEEIEYYALVLATGASSTSPLLGYTPGADIREAWRAFRAGLPGAKTIVVAGGGPSGVEVAGELSEHCNGRAGWFGKVDKKVRVVLLTDKDAILPLLRPALAKKAEEYLADVGVELVKGSKVVHVEPTNAGTTIDTVATKTIVTTADGRKFEADLYIPAMGMRANSSYIPAELLSSDGTGRIETNGKTLRVDTAAVGPRVYAIGDVATVARPAVHNIMDAVPVLGHNIKRDLTGTGVDRTFKEDKRETQLVPIGRGKGVGSFMDWALPSWFVWLLKGRDYWLWTTGMVWSGMQWSRP